jgi:hypothetical protein
LNAPVDWWSKPAADEELLLQQILRAADQWIYTGARRHVEIVPGNFRAGLQVFDGLDVGEVSQNCVYNFRNKESLVLPEVKRLLSFVWRHPSHLLPVNFCLLILSFSATVPPF